MSTSNQWLQSRYPRLVILWSPKQKHMRLIKWYSVTLLHVNNWYVGAERQHKVLNVSTSIMPSLSGCSTFTRGSGSAETGCPVSAWIASLTEGSSGRGCCSSCGTTSDRLHLALSCFGLTWATTGLTLATIAAERGLAVRPRCTVSQPSASFLPKKCVKY